MIVSHQVITAGNASKFIIPQAGVDTFYQLALLICFNGYYNVNIYIALSLYMFIQENVIPLSP